MRYRVTALTPLLVGDGSKLAPIDYMIWRDQVNVLDQRRIFRLLAKGPRLEGYLNQLRRAEKLDFASWGGFAQNFAGRRIPFEHPSLSAHWEKTRAEHLFIPTFCSGPSGAFLPGSALKGALRTGFACSRWRSAVVREIGARMEAERFLRKPGAAAEAMTLGSPGWDPMRLVLPADSAVVPASAMKVYLVRVAALQPKAPGFELAWKTAPRGSAPRAEQSTPVFAEMAAPGTEFSGNWGEKEFLKTAESSRALHWGDHARVDRMFAAANQHAEDLLRLQQQYAERAGLPRVGETLASLQTELAEVRQRPAACLLNMGWGAGFLSKVAFLDTESQDYRKLLTRMPFFAQALRTGLPFPKTRKIIFLNDQPAALAGWVRLETG